MSDQHRRVRAAAITGAGQLLGLLGSTLIGVLVAGTLPPAPRVDAFFGANQIYALALYLGQAVRITAPALVVRSGLQPRRLWEATLWLAGGTAAFMALVALTGDGLVTDTAAPDFTRDLLVLAPAASVHVVAGGMAARMAVRGSFGYAAGAYAAGSVFSGLLLLGVIDSQGAAALAPCIAAGTLATGAVMTIGYLRVVGGPRAARAVEEHEAEAGSVVGPGPDRAALATHPNAAFAVRRVVLGAVPALAMQTLIVVATVAGGHIQDGGTALLSYSFLALFAFTTIAISPMSIVLGPEVAERWDGQADSLARIVSAATRLAVVVAVPLIVLGFLVGRPLAGIVLPALTGHDLDQVFAMLAVLCPSLLLTAAATAATVGIIAADRLAELAVGLSLSVLGAALGGLLLVVAGAPLLVVAIAASACAVVYSVVTLRVALGSVAVPAAGRLVTDNLAVVAPALITTAVLAPLLRDDLLLGTLVSVPVVALHVAVVSALRRDTVQLLLGAARRRVV